MEDTRCGEECCFVKSGFCKTDKECPYFIQNYWTNGENSAPKLVSDCFPKRFMLEQNTMTSRSLAQDGTIHALRNELNGMKEKVDNLISIMQMLIKSAFPENFKLENDIKNNIEDKRVDIGG